MGVLHWKVVEHLLGILYGIAFGVKVYETVGQESVQGESCFDEV
jgi:hypothetical protein